ncbi:regakine-1-like [Clinocottus analis]|uniref:regakine-1-like n=1 Tax=Clinocottus analis TaxID=304258 RepID=UPI0035BFB7CC
MSFSRVLAALLCFTTWVGVVHATHAPVSSCCLGWSTTRVPVKRIVNYTLQTEGACSLEAVVFQTKGGRTICSDPKTGWAKKGILKVDEEKKLKMASQEMGQNEEALTSDVTPTASLPLTNTPRKKGRNRNGRKGRKNKSRRGRKGLKKCV